MEIERRRSELNPVIAAQRPSLSKKTLNSTKRLQELRKINDDNKVVVISWLYI